MNSSRYVAAAVVLVVVAVVVILAVGSNACNDRNIRRERVRKHEPGIEVVGTVLHFNPRFVFPDSLSSNNPIIARATTYC